MTVNEAAIRGLFYSPTGPVGRFVAERGHRVLDGARRQVGVGKPDPLGRSSDRTPGQLRDSLVMEPVPSDLGPAMRIGSRDPIAYLHHEGTRPHQIFPRSGGRLHFFWEKAGVEVFPRSVNHPGTRPNRYLVDQLPLALR